MTSDLEDQALQELYAWVDQIPLSRPKKNMSRDFADAVLMAEIIKHYFPKLVELHNFQAAHSTAAKKKNWQTLNWKVFKRLNFELSEDVIESIVACKPGTIERVLLLLRTKIDRNLLAGNNPASVVPTVKQKEISQGYHPQQTLNLDSAARLSGPASFSGADFVPRMAYEEKVQELLAKEETIKILSMKVSKLDHLLHLKDLRIDELQRKLGDPAHSMGDGPQMQMQAQMRQAYMQQQQQFAAPANFNGPPPQYFMPPPADLR